MIDGCTWDEQYIRNCLIVQNTRNTKRLTEKGYQLADTLLFIRLDRFFLLSSFCLSFWFFFLSSDSLIVAQYVVLEFVLNVFVNFWAAFYIIWVLDFNYFIVANWTGKSRVSFALQFLYYLQMIMNFRIIDIATNENYENNRTSLMIKSII